MRFDRKGQAAMEFLMTYGWAILAALIAIGVLVAFGVFSATNLSPDVATVTAPWGVRGWAATETADTVSLEYTFNGGSSTYIVNSYLTGAQVDGSSINCADGTIPLACDAAGEVLPGETCTVTYVCDPIAQGQVLSGDLEVVYRNAGSSLNQVSAGSISTTVQA
jgi:uncharacterized protein (UPF0333 family)